ncbi:hypothetical protein [Gordonia sp. (in: high G+C Gram-positive bacteria)]|uniref:hypothetical protein n=1 Tax=Gordonia sp. (in: high G+C Gram-positive bacteria) TaxID=84139 RepID=UPI0039E6D2BE
MSRTASGGRLTRAAVALGLALLVTLGLPAPAGAAPKKVDERLPIGILPKPLSCMWMSFPGRAGMWPVPMHAPSEGIGMFTMPRAPEHVQRLLPPKITIRTQKSGYNSVWQFALLGGHLFVKSAKTLGDWRFAPTPQCLQGEMTGLSVDGSRLVVLAYSGRIFTLESADWTPELWWWTSRFGHPIWLDPAGSRVRTNERAWSFSWLDPIYTSVLPFEQRGTWTDSAGARHPVGGAGVTTVYTLSPRGNRITILDPWLPGADPLRPGDKNFADDYSYEMQGPLDGRFVARNLSAAGSTTFLINDYGDMYTRVWDFDISGADTMFFSYTPEDQDGRKGAPNNFEGFFAQFPFLRNLFPQQFAKFQLPPPAWVKQPKVPGEITSLISIEQTGFHSRHRELRVEGRKDGKLGYWRKRIDPKASWRFVPVRWQKRLSRKPLDNRSGDTSTLTMVGPTGVNYRGRYKDGWTIELRDFDYAADTVGYRVCAGGECTTVKGFIAPTPRPNWNPRGLTTNPRLYQGFLVLDPADRARFAGNSPLGRALRTLVPNGKTERILATATTKRMLIGTMGKKVVELPRFR